MNQFTEALLDLLELVRYKGWRVRANGNIRSVDLNECPICAIVNEIDWVDTWRQAALSALTSIELSLTREVTTSVFSFVNAADFPSSDHMALRDQIMIRLGLMIPIER